MPPLGLQRARSLLVFVSLMFHVARGMACKVEIKPLFFSRRVASFGANRRLKLTESNRIDRRDVARARLAVGCEW